MQPKFNATIDAMKNFLFFLFTCSIISCSANSPSQKSSPPEVDEIADLRIFSDGSIRFNGKIITENGLPSQIESLTPSKLTRVRIIFDENTPTGLIHKTQRLFHENKITNIYSKMLSSEDFIDYNQSIVHIDILSSGKILFQGIELHPENLQIGLNNSMISRNSEFILSVSKNAQMGTVFDLQKTLAANHFTTITHQDLSKYYH